MIRQDAPGPCFFCAEVPAVDGAGRLEEAETHHASAARRIRVGDRIGLIDGAGARASAVVEAVSRRNLSFTVRQREQLPPPDPAVSIASAVPKGERFRTLVDMLAQIGVAGIVPLVCERGAVKPRRGSRDRWRRIAIEACKQSRNPHVPAIQEPVSVAESLAQLPAASTLAFADPAGGEESPRVRGRLFLYIGPEGGFSDAERRCLQAHGARAMKLGDNVLRVETAAVAAAVMSRLATRGP